MKQHGWAPMTNTPSAAERRWPGLRAARLERAIHKRVLAKGFSRRKPSGLREASAPGAVSEATAPAPRVRGGQSRLAAVTAVLSFYWLLLRDYFGGVKR